MGRKELNQTNKTGISWYFLFTTILVYFIESTVHNNWWIFTTFMLSLDLSFFFITLQIQISQLPTWSGPTLFFISAWKNTCS